MSFDGLRIALSSLQAQRRALEVTGQNVANAATEGYSRQRVGMAANAGTVMAAIHARPTGVGQGVTSTTIQRSRDQFLELRANQEHAAIASLAQLDGTLGRIELAFGEPGDEGLGAQLADFNAGWDDVGNRPTDTAARRQLVERAQTLVDGIRQIDTTLSSIRANGIEELQALVVDVNATAVRVAELNQQIKVAITSGLSPNDLLDQRDLAAASLATAVGGAVRPDGNGMLDVFLGGTALVRGSTADTLEVVEGPPPANVLSLVWAKDDQPAGVTGRAGALLTTANDIVPRYRAELASVATRVHDDVNAGHVAGFALDGTTGRDFFVWDTSGYLALNPAVAGNANLIGASSTATDTRDGSVARGIAALTGAESTYREVVVRLGVETQTAARRVEIQDAITSEVDNARDSSSGVDIDEEMTDLLLYQHAYDAAARMLTAVDESLDVLINRTGVVGR
jgi:flagellar hook-associated protein 1 FlgK